MTTFDDREKAFENKFKHDQDLMFRINARRAKLLGKWAAGLMGLTGDDAESYAKLIVSVDFDEPGTKDIIRRVLADLTARGVSITEHQVEQETSRLLDVAREQVMTD